MKTIRIAVAGLLGLFACTVLAQVEARLAWVRATVPGQVTSSAYMQLTSVQGAALVTAESPAAGTVEVHEMRMEGNIMRMRAIPKLELAAGRTLELKPGGLHLMLIGLKAPLHKGETVPIVLSFRDGKGGNQRLEIKAEVRDQHGGHM